MRSNVHTMHKCDVQFFSQIVVRTIEWMALKAGLQVLLAAVFVCLSAFFFCICHSAYNFAWHNSCICCTSMLCDDVFFHFQAIIMILI